MNSTSTNKSVYRVPPSLYWAQYWNSCLIGTLATFQLILTLVILAMEIGNALVDYRDECRDIAWKILNKLREPLMTLTIDPDGRQEHPAFLGIRTRMLDGRAPAQWLQAYWQGRKLNWWN